MGLRAYLLVDLVDDLKQEDLIRELRELEEMPGVDFVDPVIGSRDMVIMVDAPVTVEAIASRIRARESVKNLETMRIVSMFERHRNVKWAQDEKDVPEVTTRPVPELLRTPG